MSANDEDDDRHTTHPLPVLPSSGRVEQLRREMAENPQTPLAAAETPAAEAKPSNLPPELKVLEAKVIEAVSQVYDPEIPVNIYELGLIYAIDVKPDHSVDVRMTLTTPACPVAGSLPGEVQRKIEAIPEVTSANIELVWDPPWDRGMMSEAAMLQLGLF